MFNFGQTVVHGYQYYQALHYKEHSYRKVGNANGIGLFVELLGGGVK